MKKYLLLSSISLLTFQQINAQVLEFEHNPATLATTGNGDDFFVTVYNTVNNNTATNVKYQWKLINPTDLPSGWSYNGFCDNSTCYNAGTLIAWETGSPVECNLAPNARGTDFKLQMGIPDAAPAGVGTFKFRVEVLEGGTQIDTVTFIITKSTTSINAIQVEDNRVGIYPNPSYDGMVNVFVAKELKAKSLNIYNLLGQLVDSRSLNNSSEVHQLNIQNLNSGLHYFQIIDDNNQTITARQFIKQ